MRRHLEGKVCYVDATDIIQCGIREQRKLAQRAGSISKTIAGHDCSVPEMTGTDTEHIRKYITGLNSERARIGMEIRMLDRYHEEMEYLLAEIERKIEFLSSCGNPELSKMADVRKSELSLSHTVYTQMAITAELAISRYSDFADVLKHASQGMHAALTQSNAIEFIRIYENVKKAAETCRIEKKG